MMGDFIRLNYNVNNGEYLAIINGYKLEKNQIQLELNLINEGCLFRPSPLSVKLTEHNPLYQYFRKLGYDDNEMSQIKCEDLIGEKAVFTIQNEEGHTVTFSNIVNIELAN